MIQLLYTSRFLKPLKKLNPNQKRELDLVVALIASSQIKGTPKAHELSNIYVYKFRLVNQEVLLAYRIIDRDRIRLLKIGPHENFYRDLKREN